MRRQVCRRNSSCSVAVIFTPASLGARNAILTISYAGIGSPETVNLGGIGVSPLSITSSVTQLVAGTTFQFTASAPAVWTASAGTISSSGFFTAPNPPPTPAQITITATSTVNPQVFVTTQVTIAPVPAIIVPATNTAARWWFDHHTHLNNRWNRHSGRINDAGMLSGDAADRCQLFFYA